MDNKINEEGSYLLADSEINGSVCSERDFTLQGIVRNGLQCKAKLTVEKEGVIEGDVTCNELVLSGEITGNVHVSSMAYIRKGAVVKGYLIASRLILDPEANIEKGVDIKK